MFTTITAVKLFAIVIVVVDVIGSSTLIVVSIVLMMMLTISDTVMKYDYFYCHDYNSSDSGLSQVACFLLFFLIPRSFNQLGL